jgi:SAM-dependent methyltransferase
MHGKGLHATARECYEKVERTPSEKGRLTWALARRQLGIIAIQRDENDIAIEHLKNSLQANWLDPETHRLLGSLYCSHASDLASRGLPYDIKDGLGHLMQAHRLCPHSIHIRMAIEQATALSPAKEHWCRIVMRQKGSELIDSLGARLNVLEISGEFWNDHPSFASYHSTKFPDYDVCKAAPPGGPYDLIVLDQVLEHVRYPQRALENVRLSLSPHGACFVATPFLIREHKAPVDLWRWTAQGLKCLLEDAGFSPDKINADSWGNIECLTATLTRWEAFVNEATHSLLNQPDYPVAVWALARL